MLDGYDPPVGHPLLQHGEEAKERARLAIAGRVGHELQPGPLMMLGERLTVVEDDGLLRLRRLSLLIMSAGVRVPFARSLVSWAVASAVSGMAVEADAADWVVRFADDADELEAALLLEAERLIGLSDLGRKAAHILLRRLGTARARDLAAQNPEPESEDVVRRSAAHAADPCNNIFAWSDEERRLCMARAETPLHSILQRIKTDVLDPDWTMPAIVADRAVAALHDIDPVQIYGGFDATIETDRFDDLLPVLVTRAPATIARYLRRMVRLLPTRIFEGQRQLAIWLRELSPLLGPDEIAAVEQVLCALRGDATGWREPDGPHQENIGQLTEAFLTLGILPQLDPDRLARVLWMLPAVTVPADLSPPHRARLGELAGSPTWYLRALVLRYACLSADEELGRASVGVWAQLPRRDAALGNAVGCAGNAPLFRAS